MEVNKVELIGRLNFIDCKVTNSGLTITTLLLSKKVKEDFQSFNVVCFGDKAEKIAEEAQKGNYIHVIGKLQEDKYKNKEGKDVSRHSIIANEVEIVEYNTSEKRYEPKNGQKTMNLEQPKAPWEV